MSATPGRRLTEGNIKRARQEVARLDDLIRKAGGIVPYMTGPRYKGKPLLQKQIEGERRS